MPTVNPSCFHISASSIAAFKACPQRFRLSYREGLRPDRDTDSQRVGTAWHKLHEVYADALRELGASTHAPESWREAALERVVNHLNERYAEVPTWVTAEEWLLERQILLTSFIGYQWYWQNDPIEFLASEVAFNLPINSPKTGLPLLMSEVQRVGKIDHVIKWQGLVGAMERKSTSRSIAPDSDYWDKGKKDTQVSMYALAFRDMWPEMQRRFIAALTDNTSFGNTLYDVWQKPKTKPTTLTQAETATFLADGKYMDQEFVVSTGKYEEPQKPKKEGGNPITDWVVVNGVTVEVEQGKKGFAVRESVEMYAARLLQDIYARPEFYFQRREIARTDAEIVNFRKQLYNLYQSQKIMAQTGNYWENESACRATFPCQYLAICYGPGADSVCDGVTTPPNYKRIFVDVTREGATIDPD